MRAGRVNLDELAALPRGALVIVTWHDIQAEIHGDPDHAELFARQSVGWWWALRQDTGAPAFAVLSFDRALCGTDVESGWQAIPVAVISLIETVGGELLGDA